MEFFTYKILAYITAFVSFVDASTILQSKKIKKFSLERIIVYILISIFWIVYGLLKDADIFLITIEGFVCSYILLGFLLKINSSKSNKVFNKSIPGHGVSENKAFKAIKYTLLYILAGIIMIIAGLVIFDSLNLL